MFLDCSGALHHNPPRHAYGAAVADIDGDGSLEILVAGHGGPNLVLKWERRNGAGGSGRLVDIADPVLADADSQALAVAAADVDGDGREEIYVINCDKFAHRGAQTDRLFAWFGDRWLDLFCLPENARAANQAAARSVGCIDRLGRGRYGFVVTNRQAPLSLYELIRGGRVVDVADDCGLDLDGDGRAVLPGPLVSERMDLFILNEHGRNHFYRNFGDGGFEEIGQVTGLGDAPSTGRGVCVVEAGMPGRFDIVCGNWGGAHRLFVQKPGGGFVDRAPAELARPSRVRTVLAADFDNDGFQEVFFNNFGEPNRLFGWRHDTWALIDVGDAAEPHGLGTGAVVADIDGDGRLELLVTHGESGAQPLALYRAPPNDNAWLRVMPLTPAGAPARGAVVSLTAGGRTQSRLICAGSGYLCQMEPVAHFGLGTLTSAERVEVRWPDGRLAIIERPPLGRLISVPHPPT